MLSPSSGIQATEEPHPFTLVTCVAWGKGHPAGVCLCTYLIEQGVLCGKGGRVDLTLLNLAMPVASELVFFTPSSRAWSAWVTVWPAQGQVRRQTFQLKKQEALPFNRCLLNAI